MTDRPIPFSAPMVRALLDGRKTQTRRVLKPQPPTGFNIVGIYAPGLTAVFEDMSFNVITDHKVQIKFMLGDRLWVREAWCLCGQMNAFPPREVSRYEPVGYLADGDTRVKSCEMLSRGRTRASMHMPRWASRLTLIVTDVRVQRLQDISRDDAITEGLIKHPSPSPTAIKHGCDWTYDGVDLCGSPVSAFAHLWDSLNAKRGFGWDENPWVSATTFTVHHSNIDDLEPTHPEGGCA